MMLSCARRPIGLYWIVSLFLPIGDFILVSNISFYQISFFGQCILQRQNLLLAISFNAICSITLRKLELGRAFRRLAPYITYFVIVQIYVISLSLTSPKNLTLYTQFSWPMSCVERYPEIPEVRGKIFTQESLNKLLDFCRIHVIFKWHDPRACSNIR